jgi:hypothetical protein
LQAELMHADAADFRRELAYNKMVPMIMEMPR